MTATTAALYSAANLAFDKMEDARKEAFRAATYGTNDEAARAFSAFITLKGLERVALRKADDAFDAEKAA